MANIIRLKIDVTKIDKQRLFKGQKGVYLDAALIPSRDSQYGDTHMIVQDVTKEEREQGIKGNILGNGREIVRDQQPAQRHKQGPIVDDGADEDIPF